MYRYLRRSKSRAAEFSAGSKASVDSKGVGICNPSFASLVPRACLSNETTSVISFYYPSSLPVLGMLFGCFHLNRVHAHFFFYSSIFEVRRTKWVEASPLRLSLSSFSFRTRYGNSFGVLSVGIPPSHAKRWNTSLAVPSTMMTRTVKKKEKWSEVHAVHFSSGNMNEKSEGLEWTGTYEPKKHRGKKKKEEEEQTHPTKEVVHSVKVEENGDAVWRDRYEETGTEELLETAGVLTRVRLRRELSSPKKKTLHRNGFGYPCWRDGGEEAFRMNEEEEGEREDLGDLGLRHEEGEMERLAEEVGRQGIKHRRSNFLGRKKRKRRKIKRIKEREALLQWMEGGEVRVHKREEHTNRSVMASRDGAEAVRNKLVTSRDEEEAAAAEARVQQYAREGSKALIHHFPLLAREYDVEANQKAGIRIPLETVSMYSSSVVNWRCFKCQHCWKAAVFIRSILKSGCPQCTSEARPTVEKGRPEMLSSCAKEYNDPFLSLETLTIDSKKNVVWRCPTCEHLYSARVKDQAHGQKVFCSNCGKTIFGEFPQRRKGKKRLKKPKIYLRRVLPEANPLVEARIAAAVKKAYAIRKVLKEKERRSEGKMIEDQEQYRTEEKRVEEGGH